MHDPRAVGFPPNHPPMRSFLGVPVMTRGVAFGNLYLAEKQPDGSFTEEDEEIVTLLAAQAAVAIENAGSVQRDALRRAVQAQEAERKRLARELHDETGQALTSILLGLATVERSKTVDEARRRGRSVARARRRALAERAEACRRAAAVGARRLRPRAGAAPARRDRPRGRVRSTCRSRRGSVSARLPPDVETALYRIVQEALTNVVKHADAHHVSIVVTRKSTERAGVIEDDGSGFDRAAVSIGGLGLLGMRERVELLDGSSRDRGFRRAPG